MSTIVDHGHGSEPMSKQERMGSAPRQQLLFEDCALIEMIHLHDCLRGAFKTLEKDAQELAHLRRQERSSEDDQQNLLCDIEGRLTGRFKVIWSVFRAHSAAEDEFIWPALQSKTPGRLIKEEYKADHVDAESRFSSIDQLLTEYRECLGRNRPSEKQAVEGNLDRLSQVICQHTRALSRHMMMHLEKEETDCLPLVRKHLSISEIRELVGRIMGKRSADTIAQIMTMAVQTLHETDRLAMVNYMKQAMSGTFFDRWLLMSGWITTTGEGCKTDQAARDSERPALPQDVCPVMKSKRFKSHDHVFLRKPFTRPWHTSEKTCHWIPQNHIEERELQKLIRAISSNPEPAPEEKKAMIRTLRHSVWRSNRRHRARVMHEDGPEI